MFRLEPSINLAVSKGVADASLERMERVRHPERFPLVAKTQDWYQLQRAT